MILTLQLHSSLLSDLLFIKKAYLYWNDRATVLNIITKTDLAVLAYALFKNGTANYHCL